MVEFVLNGQFLLKNDVWLTARFISGLVLDDAVQRLDGMITHNLSLPQQHNATVGKRCVLLLTWVAKAFVAKALDLATGFTEQVSFAKHCRLR